MTTFKKMIVALAFAAATTVAGIGTASACGPYGPPTAEMVEREIEWAQEGLDASIAEGDLELARWYIDRLVTLSDQLEEIGAEDTDVTGIPMASVE